MNYTVHALMYTYFGMTQCGPTAKRLAKRVSMFITLLQLSQMVRNAYPPSHNPTDPHALVTRTTHSRIMPPPLEQRL